MPKTKTTTLAKPKPKQEIVQTEDSGVEMLIAKAIDKDTSVEVMEKLLAMRRDFLAEQAKKAFDESMAKFQEECPVIEKTKAVYEKGSTTKVRYKYAVLDSIVSQTKGAIASNGLSYAFDELKDEQFTTIICIVTHIAGHSRQTSFKIPIGSEAYMSDVQKYGARMTFGKRYSFCNAFGITTGDEDNDAQDTGKPVGPQPKPQARPQGKPQPKPQAKPAPTYHPAPQTPPKKFHCVRHWSQLKEKVEISPAEAVWSKKKCGYELCRKCQDAYKEAQSTEAPKGAEKPESTASEAEKELAEVNSWDKKPDTKEVKDDVKAVGEAVETENEKLAKNIDRAKTVGKSQKII